MQKCSPNNYLWMAPILFCQKDFISIPKKTPLLIKATWQLEVARKSYFWLFLSNGICGAIWGTAIYVRFSFRFFHFLLCNLTKNTIFLHYTLANKLWYITATIYPPHTKNSWFLKLVKCDSLPPYALLGVFLSLQKSNPCFTLKMFLESLLFPILR